MNNGANGAEYETANYAQVIGNSFIDCKVLTLDNSNSEPYPVYGTQFFNNLIAYNSNIGGSGVIGNSSADYGSPLLKDHGGRAAGNYVYSASTSQLGSAANILGGSVWLKETFTPYTNGQSLNTTLSPQLINNVNFTNYTKITNDGGNVARYLKTATSGGSQVMFAFSPTNTMTARTNGYVSFRVKQNINTTISISNSFDIGIGNNALGTSTASSANRLIGLSFRQSGSNTNTLTVKSGDGWTNAVTISNSASLSKAEIWFNDSETSSMPYTDPSGGYQNLTTNSFVVYFVGKLVTPSASGSPLTGASGASLNIGKIGFSTASTTAIDFSFGDIYAADSENTSLNVISSLSADNPLLSGTYDVLMVPAGTSPLIGKASSLPSINDTSATGATYNLAGTLATYGALDMRGLSRPLTGGDIGNYEVEVSGLGNRPLRRMEVGIVPATYPNSIQVNSITQGIAFSQQFSASSGTGEVTWSCLGSLPSGITLSSSGLLSGTTTSSGTFPVVLRLTDANGSYAEISTSLTVVATVVAPVISSSTSATGEKSAAFSYTITASGSPTSYNATPLPAGLNFNTSTGAITGSPTVGGVFSVTISATNEVGTGSTTLTLNFTDEFDALRLKWRDTLIASAGTVVSINANALKYWTGNSPINASPAPSFSSPTFYLWSDLPLNTGVSGNMRDTFGRLETMALGYATPGSAYYGNPTLATAVINGLNWMVTNVYNSTNTYDNWYHWMITGSENFANAALLVYPALSQAQITSYYNKIQYYGPSGGPSGNSPWPTSYKWSLLTGANTAEAALVMTLNGVLNRSEVKLTEAKTNLAKVFTPVIDGDGFYSDGGYIFHFNAVENGSYGLTLIEAVSAATNLLYGTPWAVAEADASQAYNNWIPKGLMPFYYRGAMMHMIRGRSYTTSGSTEFVAGASGLDAIRNVILFAPTLEASTLTAFINSPHPEVGQYMFPSIDRVVAHRSNFSLGLSLSSSRTCNFDPMSNTPSTENNVKGWNTADGMTSLYIGSTDTQFTGNIWPTMDWYHMTGTTAEQNYQAQPGTPSENWAGGAEVSGYGVAGMSLHPKDSSTASSTLYGKKSYFMLEKEVVCLGSGITAGSANEIHTTVENRRMGSSTASINLWVDGVATSRALNWNTTLTSPKSCAIEGVGGYYFPDSPNNIRAEFVPSSGKWTDIHPTDSDVATYTDNYLRLIFNHGASPSAATYAYTLLPTMTPSEVAGYAYNPQTTILSNTETVQAVKNPALGVVAANFWNSAGGTADLLTVNKSCSVIVRETYNSISVGLSDPSQTLTGPGGLITVTLNRTGTLSSKDAEVTDVRTTPTIQFTANVSGARGKTIHATFSLAAAPQITSNLNLVALTSSPVELSNRF